MKLSPKKISGGSTQEKHSLDTLSKMHREYRRLIKLRELLLEDDRILAVDGVNCVVLPKNYMDKNRKRAFREMNIRTPLKSDLSRQLSRHMRLYIDKRLEELGEIFSRHQISVEAIPKGGVVKIKKQPTEGDKVISDEDDLYTIHNVNYIRGVADSIMLVTTTEPERFIPLDAEELEWDKSKKVWRFIE